MNRSEFDDNLFQVAMQYPTLEVGQLIGKKLLRIGGAKAARKAIAYINRRGEEHRNSQDNDNLVKALRIDY
jgi:hypothetical protein